MKKLIISLGLIVMLISWSGPGDLGIGAAPALAQPPPPGYGYCDPYYYNCNYNNYYTAPYSDPITQFFYYTVPQVGGARRYYRERGRYGREHRRWNRRHGPPH
ncbi:MAG: hypothetical protein M1438_06425 [Deltaproteobacteria bacterium]|nr:hypothetical protein [Deltaproteobacteria bacterium]